MRPRGRRPRGRGGVPVRPRDQQVDQAAAGDHREPDRDDPAVEEGLGARRGLDQQDDGEDPVGERQDVDREPGGPEVPHAGRAPPPQPLAQRGEHHGLERHVDAEHGERRDAGEDPLLEEDEQRDQHRHDADDEQGVRGHGVPGRHARQPAARGEHPVAGEGVQQPAAGRLQREHAGQERDDGDDQEDLGARGAQGADEDRRDRVGVLAGDDGLQVGRGQHVARVGQEARDASHHDREDHRARDLPGRVGDLLGDVAAGLEAVEQEQPGQRRGQEHPGVGLPAAGAEGVEEDRERLLAPEQQEEQPERDDADELGGQADPGDARQHPGAAVVHDHRDHSRATVDARTIAGVASTPKSAATNPPPNSATAVMVTMTAQM